MKKVREWDIQNLLYKHLQYDKQHQCIYPNNCGLFGWEADMISATKAGFVNEYEIKISKADFRADFKKPKHKSFLKENVRHKHYPAYFWYVTYGFEVTDEMIPSYAGHIEIVHHRVRKNQLMLDVKKKAPKINDYKLNDKRRNKLYSGMYYKYWNIREKELKLLEEENK